LLLDLMFDVGVGFTCNICTDLSRKFVPVF